MVTHVRNCALRIIAASLALAAIPAFAEETEGRVRLGQRASEGVVRVSDDARFDDVRGQSPGMTPTSHVVYDGGAYCPPPNQMAVMFPDCYPHWDVLGNCALADWFRMQSHQFHAYHSANAYSFKQELRADCAEKHAWLRHKFGYFVPTGCNGKGCPPIGSYSMVYPIDPGYFDRRDGQIYGTAGTGGPVSVPLAPVVHHTYNYGWGIPSSRLTPVLHPNSAVPPTVPAHYHAH